eukprot:c49113_g1_i1 orf=207-374(+)
MRLLGLEKQFETRSCHYSGLQSSCFMIVQQFCTAQPFFIFFELRSSVYERLNLHG